MRASKGTKQTLKMYFARPDFLRTSLTAHTTQFGLKLLF